MSSRPALAGMILLAGVASFSADGAMADTVAIATAPQASVRDYCKQKGGTFYTNKSNGSYGCMLDDGTGIYCGGATAEQKRTCETVSRMWPYEAQIMQRLVAGKKY